MSSAPTPSSLDPNFRVPPLAHELRWRAAAEVAVVEGRGWDDAAPFARLPDRARGVVPDPVWELSRHAAGVSLAFTTDSPVLAARWRPLNPGMAMDHMPAIGVSGVDLYRHGADGWRWCAVGRDPSHPWSQALLFEGVSRASRRLRLHLPLYNGVGAVEIGVLPDAAIAAGPRAAGRPICFYGTSITQGGCASRPGMAYPAILSRRLDRPALNLGFSGNGRMEPALAALLAELDPCAYVLDALPNLTGPEIGERFVPFVRALRAARPATPIALVGHIRYDGLDLAPARAQRLAAGEAAFAAAVRALRDAGVPGLHVIDGARLLGDDGEATVDGVHPTDLGFLRMADVLEAPLRAVLAGR